jgi:hypothetical protein
MDLDTRVEIPADVVSREVDGETVLLDLASETYFGLDGVGTRIWQLIGSGHDLRRVHRILLDEYEVDAAALEVDLLALVGELLAAGLLAPAAPGGPGPR